MGGWRGRELRARRAAGNRKEVRKINESPVQRVSLANGGNISALM